MGSELWMSSELYLDIWTALHFFKKYSINFFILCTYALRLLPVFFIVCLLYTYTVISYARLKMTTSKIEDNDSHLTQGNRQAPGKVSLTRKKIRRMAVPLVMKFVVKLIVQCNLC